MLIGGMVNNQIHNNLNISFVSLVKHLFEQIKVAVILVDIFVIGNVVAEICIG